MDFGEAVWVEDRVLIHRLLPISIDLAPVDSDIAQDQPDQLGNAKKRLPGTWSPTPQRKCI